MKLSCETWELFHFLCYGIVLLLLPQMNFSHCRVTVRVRWALNSLLWWRISQSGSLKWIDEFADETFHWKLLKAIAESTIRFQYNFSFYLFLLMINCCAFVSFFSILFDFFRLFVCQRYRMIEELSLQRMKRQHCIRRGCFVKQYSDHKHCHSFMLSGDFFQYCGDTQNFIYARDAADNMQT